MSDVTYCVVPRSALDGTSARSSQRSRVRHDGARQLRFTDGSTTDDHVIHIVGYMEKDGKDWFLIKDSGSSARNGKIEGYMFYHEDYVKLKMMNFIVHRNVVERVSARLE